LESERETFNKNHNNQIKIKNMKKTILTLLTVALATSFAISQTVDDGIKFLYYQRYKSAKETLTKVVASKPKDAFSIYWLGQAYLGDDHLDSAKSLYQKALSDGVNDPWIWVGTGHVQILENNDVNSAKQKFEQAITSAPKGKKGVENADILNAIGRAMADGSSQQGDPQYGVDKLKRAAEINTTNPDIDINLGICYLKQGSDKGGVAVEAFTDATRRNPQYAGAYFRIGKIYESQNNTEYMNEWFGKAITADPAYAPAYLEYFNYYAERDVNKAKEYLDKYVANADKDCTTDYFVADYLYRAGKFQESLDKAKAMENGACKDYVRVNILYAYDYNKLGDSVTALNAVQKFFASAPAKIEPSDYVIAGTVAGKVAGHEDSAVNYLRKAIELDTVKANKLEYMNLGANIMAKAQKIDSELVWMSKIMALKGDSLSESDYYKLSKATTDALSSPPHTGTADSTSAPGPDSMTINHLYVVADSITQAYIKAFPNKAQGYSFRVLAAKKADEDTSKGLAVEPIKQYNEFLKRDTAASNKKTIFTNDYYLLVYYAEHAKDMQKAITLTDEMMQVFPNPPGGEEYDFASKTKQALESALKKSQQPPPSKQPAGKSPGAKPKAKPKAGSKP
jgi:tetratricopeptide (TPR) repeat protein